MLLGGVLTAAAAILLLILLIKTSGTQKGSSFLLEYFENKFKLTFQIDKNDEAELNSFLENLALDWDINQGLVFELDSTSSAKLAFQTPLLINLDINGKKSQFSAELNQPIFKEKIEASQLEIPDNTEFALFAPDLSEFAVSKLEVDDEIKKILTDKVKSQLGQYFLSFDSAKNFALYFKNPIDLGQMTEIPLESTNQVTSNENQSVKIYQMKFPSNDNINNEVTPVFFEQNGYKVLASSSETASMLLAEHKTRFPKEESGTTFELFLKPNDNFSPKDFSKNMLKNGISNVNANEKFNESLSQIKEVSFSLKGTTFSGLIRTE